MGIVIEIQKLFAHKCYKTKCRGKSMQMQKRTKDGTCNFLMRTVVPSVGGQTRRHAILPVAFFRALPFVFTEKRSFLYVSFTFTFYVSFMFHSFIHLVISETLLKLLVS